MNNNYGCGNLPEAYLRLRKKKLGVRDGYPEEPGIYNLRFDGSNMPKAQTKYQNFLNTMYKTRPNFKLLAMSTESFFSGVSILVTYQI